MLEYDAVFQRVVEEALDRYDDGKPMFFELSIIPNIESLDYSTVMKELIFITKELVGLDFFIEEFEDFDLYDEE